MNFADYQPYLMMIGGLFFVWFALTRKNGNRDLKKDGILVEGIIFKNTHRSDSNDRSFSKYSEEITVRFVTETKEWITAPVTQDFFVSGSGKHKEGKRIMIYYDPKNPQRFYIDQNLPSYLGRAVFVIIGLFFIAGGLFKVLST